MSVTRRTLIRLAGAALAAPYVTQARAAVSPQHLGAMLMSGFAGSTHDAPGAQALAEQISHGLIGGVCLLGYNVRSRAGVEGLTRLFGGAGAKTLIAVDQEGGAVQRLTAKLGYDSVPRALSVAQTESPAQATQRYGAMAHEMRAAGFNFNLAPVVDLGFEPRNPIIAKFGRAFGADSASVVAYASAFVVGHRRERVLTALKHFPGHGSTLVDSHENAVNLTPTWREDELTPYRELVKAGLVDSIMAGHLTHAKLTGSLPASLSAQAIDGLLRGEIGYQGVVMTDDLDMAAIRERYSVTKALVMAIAAGNDVILLSNSAEPDPDLPATALAAVSEAVANGVIKAGRIEEAAQRIAQLKARI